jgi:hypothetical protein
MITGAAEAALEEAITAHFKSAVANTPELRLEYEHIAHQWRELAGCYKRAEKLSGYIQWRSQILRDYT